MDQFYYESGYIEEKYFAYVADAEVDLTDYIDGGYIELNYYNSPAGYASLSCELTEKVGEIVEAFGTWTVTVTQTATISHIEGADLFALTDAALAVAVQRIRDTNIDAQAAFDIATDGRVYRDVSADVDAALSLSATNSRSRASTLETQAAFSFDSSADRIRSSSSDLTVTANLSCTISHIEGADIVATGFASLSVDANAVFDSVSTQTSTFTNDFVVSQTFTNNTISLRSAFIPKFSKYTGSGRPRNLTASSGTIQSSIKKFGAGASSGSGGNATSLETLEGNPSPSAVCEANVIPNVTDDFILEGWFYPTANENYDLIFFGSKFVRLSMASDGDLWFRWYKNGSTTATTIYNGSTARTLNTWHHWAIVNNSSGTSLYLDGTRLVNYPHTVGDTWTGYGELTAIYVSTSATLAKYVDEYNFQVGTRLGVDPSSSSMTVPTAARTNDPATTVFLYHFDTDYTDDTKVSQTGSASLSSQFSQSAQITGIQRASTDLSAAFTSDFEFNKITGASLTAFTNGSLTADNDRIRSFETSIESTSLASVTGHVIAGAVSNQNSEFAQSVDYLRIRSSSIDTDAIATELTAAAKIADFFVNISTAATMSSTVVKTTDIDLALNAEFTKTFSGDRIRFGISDQTSQASISAAANRTRDTSSDLDIEVTQTAAAVITASAVIDLALVVSQITDVSGFVGIIARLDSAFDQTTDIIRLRPGEAAISSAATFAVNTDISVIRNTTADVDAAAEISVNGVLNRDFTATMQAWVAETAISAKIGDFLVTLESSSTLTANAVKNTTISSDLTADTTWSATGVKNVDISLDLDTEFTQTANVRTNLDFVLDTSAEFNLSSQPIKTVDAQIDLTAFGNFNLTARATRNNEINAYIDSTVSLVPSVIRTSSVDLDSQFTKSFNGTKLVYADANLSLVTALSAEVREIFIEEIIYVIPGEIWEFSISAETRLYTISSETREYTIQGD